MKNVLKIEGVDETRSKTNDIFTIADVLGIEAARNVIINEASEIILRSDGNTTDLGYPWSVHLNGNKYLVVYYMNKSIWSQILTIK